jgi:hypothetical protein
MRYCGNCGTPLDDHSIANRRCTTCGADIHASGDLPYVGDGGTGALTTPVTPLQASSPYAPSPLWQVAPPPPPVQPPRRQGVPTVLAFVGGVITTCLVLTLLVAIITRHPRTQSTGATPGQTNTTATPLGQPTQVPGTKATGNPGGGTPQTTTTPVTATPPLTATVQATVTSAPNQGFLSIQPQTDFFFITCVNRSLTFDVANTGKGTLSFQITGKTSFTVNPTQGSLDGGEKQAITVSKINGTTTLIVAAPGAQNQPITVTIHCGVSG